MTDCKPIYNLEQRTFQFAKSVPEFSKLKFEHKQLFYDDLKQLIRASGSVGANYIEANESFSKKDFYYRIKICRKESKESAYFLKLLSECNHEISDSAMKLNDEANQLKRIFSSIIEKSPFKNISE